MSQHTATPWVYDQKHPYSFFSDDATGSIIGECPKYMFVYRTDDERKANARRIVASVNACATVLDVKELEEGRFVFGSLRDFTATQKECDDAKSQRDELVAAYENLRHMESTKPMSVGDDVDLIKARERMAKAVAAAKGGKS